MHVQSDDEVIVNRCLEGDQAAFAFLVSKYKEAVHAYAYHKVLDYQEAQDIVQEVFIKAYKKLAQLKWPHRFQSWLYTIASNECKMWLRSRSKEREREVPLEDVPVENLDALAVRAHSDEDIKLTVKSAMETLPDDSQLALSLYYMSGLSTREVASFMGISPNNAGVKLHRARKQLGERLEKMIGRKLEKEKLKSGFTFTIMNSIRSMPIPSLPKPRPTRWAPIPISIGMALLIGIIGYGVSSGRDVSPDMPVLKQETFAVSLLPDPDRQTIWDTEPENIIDLTAADAGDPEQPQPTAGTKSSGMITRRVWENAQEKVPHKPNFTKIQIPTKPGNGALSPDGKKFAFVSQGSMWVVPVHGKVSPDIAGEPVRLPGTGGAWRVGMCWSADGRWIAYSNLKDDAISDEICIVPSSGGKVKKIIRKRTGLTWYDTRLSLSPDGKVVAFASEEKGKLQLFAVHVEGGDVKRLTQDGGTQPAFSPDGKRIAYVEPQPQETGNRKSDVCIIPPEGGAPVQVSDLPGRAVGPVWSPDGKMLAFTRTGENSISEKIYIAPVSKTGRPESSPAQIELPLTTSDLLAGWTPDNEIGVLLENPEHLAIYTVPVSGGNATQVTPQGYAFHPRWSPDGERIYFRWFRDGYGSCIGSVPSEGGEISIGPLDADSRIFEVYPGGGNVVSPDGKKIAFSGAIRFSGDSKRDDEVAIYIIPIEGGEPKKLTISPGQDSFPCWSPDGRSIAFLRLDYYAPKEENDDYIRNICIVPTEGAEVRQLTSESHRVQDSAIAWSPDGKWIAYFSRDNEIRVIPIQGGESREVAKVERVYPYNSELDWSPDGKKLAYSSKGSIWAVSLDAGEPKEIRTGLDAKATDISWSPDGKKIAFTASKGGDVELWLMEDFLPAQSE
jgi:RNA polymerase sigma factor (sigma-70 family)